jgi:thymidylate synthase (FAD)
MKQVEQQIEIMTQIPADLNQKIEKIGRVCYKSEDRITPDSAGKFVAGLVKNGHHSVLEHFTVTVRFITDRGISHEIVRHRIGVAYSQESTRYCNYGGEGITVINPPLNDYGPGIRRLMDWTFAVLDRVYRAMIRLGVPPQIARAILPTALKTEIICTLNLRAWRHFFELRCSPKAHPQMREIACQLFGYMCAHAPMVFGDLGIAIFEYPEPKYVPELTENFL